MSRQQGLVARCPRCRANVPADTFAGLTTYNQHRKDKHSNLCKNSNQPTPYRAKQSFAGHLGAG